MATESVIFTALPNGFDADGRLLRVTVFVSPRLLTDGAGDLALLGSGFDAFQDWPAALAEVRFALTVDGFGTLDVEPDPSSPAADSGTWHLLFDGCRVRDGGFKDLSGNRFLSFPVRTMAQSILGLYGEVAEGFPTAFPPVTSGPVSGLAKELGLLASHGRRRYYDMLDEHIKREEGRRGKSGRYLDRDLIPGSQRRFLAFAEAYRFYDRPDSRDPAGPTAVPDPPKPPEIDFHGAVATCGDYPELLRHLGLAVDLVCRRERTMPPEGRVRVEARAPQPFEPWMGAEEARPWTHYLLDKRRFLPSPREKEGDIVDGTLRLENTRRFLVNQLDVDGSAMKTVDFAGNALRLNDHLTGHTRSMVEDAASLPALRTGGFTVARDARAGAVVSQVDSAAEHEDDHSNGTPADLFAEDVTRGYRLDVEDATRPERWLSLHQRVGTYRVEPAGAPPVDLGLGPDEGFAKGASSASVPGHEEDLYLHEAMFGWEGWSLSAKRPGRAITNDGVAEIEPENPTDVPLYTSFEAERGTLPRLRFGRTYRFRARTVDLAGNSVAEDGIVPQHATEEQTFRRFDPVPSPAVVPRRPFTEGESLLRMVIRSTLDVLPAAYVGLPRIVSLAGHTDPLTAYLLANERHLSPPLASQQLAEWHGRFDLAVGESASEAALNDQFAVAARESGSYLEPGPDVFVVNTDPGATPTDLADPNRRKGDPLQPGEYVCHDTDGLSLPYLPDPLSLGASFTTLPGDPGTRLRKWPAGADWFDRRPFRIRIEDGAGSPVFNAAERLLTVFLPQAEMVTVQLSSFVDPADLELMAVWMLERPVARGAQQADAEQGRHWMLTPWQLLTLVHAVEKPLTAPVIQVPAAGVPQSGVRRNVGETFAVLAGRIASHARSTGRLDVEARWTEPVDDLAKDAPGEIDGQAHVGDFLLTASENGCRIGRDDAPAAGAAAPVHRLRHEFRDTKHRWVRYRATATTRFREYFPPEITNDRALVTHDGPEVLLNVPSSRRPEPPEVLYVVPTWTWDQRTTLGIPRPGTTRRPPSSTLRTRSGGGLRVYLDRPWYSSGDDELLGVVLEDQPWLTWPVDVAAGIASTSVLTAIADDLAEQILGAGLVKGAGPAKGRASERLVAGLRKMKDPEERQARVAATRTTDRHERALAAHVLAEHTAADAPVGAPAAALDISRAFSAAQLTALDQALSAFLLPQGDPQQFVTQWGLDPIWGSAPVDPGPYVHQFPLRVAVGGGISLSEAPGHTVTVVGHKPAFDPDRKLWYCDLQLNAGKSYFPFVRLALARYQPHSISGQHLSKVVFPEFIQLVAPRTAGLTKVSSDWASVSLRGPAGFTENADDLVTLFGGLDQLVALTRFAVAQVERLPANAATDLGWAPVGDEVRLELDVSNGLRDVRYFGRVPIPRREQGQQLRLALREYEIFRTDESEADDHLVRAPLGFESTLLVRPVKYRLVYADNMTL
jgi:hypothetical protein